MRTTIAVWTLLILAAAGPTAAAQQGADEMEASSQQESEYARATAALDRGNYDRAIELFERVAAAGGNRADAAVYWLAYARYQAGDGVAAIDTLRELRSEFPASEWLDDARYLEAEIRGSTGMPSAEEQAEDEMRLYALNALMHSAPERARPALIEMLEGDTPIEVKRQALYVLMQADDDESVELFAGIATTSDDAELRMIALQSLALMGGDRAGEVLDQVYRDSSDPRIKRAVLEAWAISSSDASDRLMGIARTDPDEEMRIGAIQALAIRSEAADLWSLYEGESSVRVRRAVLEHMFMTGDTSRLLEVARNEPNTELRVAAIRGLGMMGTEGDAAAQVAQMLQEAYVTGERRVRTAVLETMAMTENIAGLIALFDQEQDPETRMQIVQAVSMSNSPEAIEFLTRIIQR